jgi:hypothetical protein
MTLRLADDTPGREKMVTALRSPTLGIRTPPEEVEISETNVATKIQATSLLGLSTPALLFTSQGIATPLCLSILTIARIKLTTQPESGMLVDE